MMSGNSSEQMSYLNEQLREKDREMDELRGKQAELSEQTAKAQDDLALFKETTRQETTKMADVHEKELSELNSKVENLVRDCVQHIYKDIHMVCTFILHKGVLNILYVRTYITMGYLHVGTCTSCRYLLTYVHGVRTYVYMHVHYVCIYVYVYTFLQTLYTEELKDTLETRNQEFQEEKNVCTYVYYELHICTYVMHFFMQFVFSCTVHNMY